MGTTAKSSSANIEEKALDGHRFCKKLTNNDYGTVAFLLSKGDILRDKGKNAESFKDKELKYNCIYFLIGYEQVADGSIEKMYVGQAGIRINNESVLDRLNEHVWSGKDPEKYRDKWTDIVVVTNEKEAWGATELDALEHLFWSLIPVGNRYNSDPKSCKGADLNRYDEAVKQIKAYLDYLQYSMFKAKTDKELTNNIKQIADAKSEFPVDLDKGTTRIPNITTPPSVVKKMLDMLPDDVWNDETVFLDPACKDGGFLRAIYDRLRTDPKLLAKYENADKLKNHILSEQLYGIALNQNSKAATVDNLDGFRYNIAVITNYIQKLKRIRLSEIINKEFEGKNMKFDVILGNPPYNDDDTKVATAIYSRFAEDGMEMADKCSAFIIPARWYASGRGLDRFREIMLTQHKIKKLVDYEDEKMIFPDRTIAGGVCYFLADKEDNKICEITSIKKDGSKTIVKRELDKYEIFVRDTGALSIIDKIKMDKDFYSLSIGVQSVDYFNVKDNPNVSYMKVDDEMISIIDSSGYMYAYRDYLNDPYNLIDAYNVIVTHAVGSKQYVIPKTLKIIKPGQACSVTYLCIGGTPKKENAENLLKYIKTRFVRFLIKQALSGINISAKSFIFVPMQDFKTIEEQECKESSRIDWSQSITNIDQQLYKKYNLTEAEIAYIEKEVSPMDEPSSTSPKTSKLRITNEDLIANYINNQIKEGEQNV